MGHHTKTIRYRKDKVEKDVDLSGSKDEGAEDETLLVKEAKQEAVGERTVRFVASTDTEDREKDVVEPQGIRTTAFEDNPVALFAHDNRSIPIGRVVNWFVQDGKFLVDIRFDEDEFSDLVYNKVQGGSLNAVSIGFIPRELEERDGGDGLRFTQVELLEVSVVPVPANPDATAVVRTFEKMVGEYKEGRRNREIDIAAKQHAIEMIEFSMGEREQDQIGACPFKGTHDDDEGGERAAEGEKVEKDAESEDEEDRDESSVNAKNLNEADQLELEGLIEGKRVRLDKLAEMLGDDLQLSQRRRNEMLRMLDREARANDIMRRILEESGAARAAQDNVEELDEDDPEQADTDPATKEVLPFQDWPLAARDREWNSEGAVGRWREFTDSENEPSAQYPEGFIYVEDGARENFTAYKLPIVDVIDGAANAVPRAVFASAAAVQGARGGVDIPDGEESDVKVHIERYYEKMREEWDDDEVVAPWNSEAEFVDWLREQADVLEIKDDEFLCDLADRLQLDAQDVWPKRFDSDEEMRHHDGGDAETTLIPIEVRDNDDGK